MMKSMAKTLPNGRGSTSPTSTTSSSSGVSSAASHLSSTLAGRNSKNNSKSCDRIHAIGRNLPGIRRRDKSLDSHVKYRTDAKSSSKGHFRSFFLDVLSSLYSSLSLSFPLIHFFFPHLHSSSSSSFSSVSSVPLLLFTIQLSNLICDRKTKGPN